MLNQNDNITLASIAVEIADNITRSPAADRDDLAPTRGRVLDSTTDDSVYIGTGDSWLNLADAVDAEAAGFLSGAGGLSSGGATDLSTVTGELGVLRRHDGSGTDQPAGLYEWKGSSWEEIAGSGSITPA